MTVFAQGGFRYQKGLEFVGAGLVGIAVLWWIVVYGQVVANTGIPVQRTFACMVYTSDLCSLSMSLCKQWHLLGIKRYSAELLWIGIAVCGVALAVGSANRRPDQDDQGDKP
jgi:hypothetical protein